MPALRPRRREGAEDIKPCCEGVSSSIYRTETMRLRLTLTLFALLCCTGALAELAQTSAWKYYLPIDVQSPPRMLESYALRVHLDTQSLVATGTTILLFSGA